MKVSFSRTSTNICLHSHKIQYMLFKNIGRRTGISMVTAFGLAMLFSFNASAQIDTPNIAESMSQGILAFPGAEGFGRFTTGGRGGTVYHVTNLNDSGVGSFRYAVEQSGPRTIVFDVAGTIHLLTDLKIQNDHISIFGQTAPGGGIATQGNSVVIQADNVIIQHIRFRPGNLSGGQPDAIWGREQKDIIIDHCSMSWAIDEAASFYDNVNFTLQWSLLSESLYLSDHEKGAHGYGGIWGGQGATFHHNLLAHHSSRNPRFNGSRYSGQPELEVVDYRNNVIYNWGDNSAYGGELGNHNMVANYYKPGPATPEGEKSYRILDAKPPSGDFTQLGWWYVEDNVVYGNDEVSQDNWDGGVQRVTATQIDTIRMTEPFPAPELPSFESAEEAYLNVLGNVGALLPKRDKLDARIISEVANGTATYGGAFGAESGIIDSQEDVGGWPVLEDTTNVPLDTDQDGMPDAWETENELDPQNADDGKVITESGYSNLELYIHSLSEGKYGQSFPGGTSLIYPVNDFGVEVRPEFIWASALNVDQYEVEIRSNEDPDVVVLDTLVSDTTFTMSESNTPLKASTTHFWKVRGINSTGVGGWSNIRYFMTGTGTSVEDSDVIPGKVELLQNYPNPFNPLTKISYNLPFASDVSLKVYNITGRLVADLFSGFKESGTHTADFDASGLSTGTYYYKLKVTARKGESYHLSRSMLLIR